MKKSFGLYIRICRERQGRTLVAVAKAAKLHASSLCDIEKGRRKPSFDVARRLARVLALDMHDVLSRAGILTPAALAYVKRTPALVKRLNREAHLRVAA